MQKKQAARGGPSAPDPTRAGDLTEEPEEESGEFEASTLDAEGCGRQHGRRRSARGLDDRESSDLPDEPPPGYPG